MWKNININKNLLKYDTGKATLISMPHKSKYNGFQFWHPSKLVRDSFLGDYAANIGYSEDFVFHLKRYGAASKKVLEELDISVSEFESVFYVMNGVTGEPEEPVINVPEYKDPITPYVEEELKDE